MTALIPSPLFTLTQFAEWAKTKPANETYAYGSNFKCPLAQFLHSQGYVNYSVGAYDYGEFGGKIKYMISDQLSFVVHGRSGNEHEWTFGALNDRLSAVAGKQETFYEALDW